MNQNSLARITRSRGIAFAIVASLVVLGTGHGGGAFAQTAARGTLSEFMGAIYAAPPGWQEQTQTSFRTLVAPAARPGQLLIVMIRTAQPATKDAEAELNALADNAEAKTRRLSRGAVESAQRGNAAFGIVGVFGREEIEIKRGAGIAEQDGSRFAKEEVIRSVLRKGLRQFASLGKFELGFPLRRVHSLDRKADVAHTIPDTRSWWQKSGWCDHDC
jgi:hypothetical protein